MTSASHSPVTSHAGAAEDGRASPQQLMHMRLPNDDDAVASIMATLTSRGKNYEFAEFLVMAVGKTLTIYDLQKILIKRKMLIKMSTVPGNKNKRINER